VTQERVARIVPSYRATGEATVAVRWEQPYLARFVEQWESTTDDAEFKAHWLGYPDNHTASGAYTLSSASVINITTTSASPRVYVTVPA